MRTRAPIVRKVAGGVAGALLVIWLPSHGPAETAPCLPGTFDPAWLSRFAVEGGGQGSAGDLEAATTSGVIRFFPLDLAPSRGPAPLQVGMLWFLGRPPDDPVVEIDADGDGQPEVVDSREENLGHVYPRPGHYPATVTVRERDGKVTTYQRPITVLTPAAFEAELQRVWTALKAALKKGDADAARNCIHSGSRGRQERSLRALLRGDVERELPPIRFVRFLLIEARYETIRKVRIGPYDTARLDVRFHLDRDGIWRVASFAPMGIEP